MNATTLVLRAAERAGSHRKGAAIRLRRLTRISLYYAYSRMYQFDSSALIAIPGGDFRMGQADGRDEERPVHCVSVEPFRLSRYQVTNADYDAFLRSTGRDAPPFRADPKFGCPNPPVVGGSWFDA